MRTDTAAWRPAMVAPSRPLVDPHSVMFARGRPAFSRRTGDPTKEHEVAPHLSTRRRSFGFDIDASTHGCSDREIVPLVEVREQPRLHRGPIEKFPGQGTRRGAMDTQEVRHPGEVGDRIF